MEKGQHSSLHIGLRVPLFAGWLGFGTLVIFVRFFGDVVVFFGVGFNAEDVGDFFGRCCCPCSQFKYTVTALLPLHRESDDRVYKQNPAQSAANLISTMRRSLAAGPWNCGGN
jgi:hypothetical protein